VMIRYANAALLISLVIAGAAAARNTVAPNQTAIAKPQPSPPNADADFALVQTHCSACHTLDQVTAARKTPDEWAETIDRMVDHGMQITPEDTKRIAAYLNAHFGTK